MQSGLVRTAAARLARSFMLWQSDKIARVSVSDDLAQPSK